MDISIAVDVGKFEWQSALLVSSILKNNIEFDNVFIGISEKNLHVIDPFLLKFFEKLDCHVFETTNTEEYFDEYRHANKMICANQCRARGRLLNVDTDTVFLKHFSDDDFERGVQLMGCRAKGSTWRTAFKDRWSDVYEALGVLQTLNDEVIFDPPYLNSGVIFFDKKIFPFEGKSTTVTELWLRFARSLDKYLTIAESRPWLDQVALCAVASVLGSVNAKVLTPRWNCSPARYANRAGRDPIILHYHGGHQPTSIIESLGAEKLRDLLDFGANSMTFDEFERLVTRSAERHERYIWPYRSKQIDIQNNIRKQFSSRGGIKLFSKR